MTTLRFTQITDLHLGSARDSTLAGVRTAESFESVLQALERQGRGSDMLLLTGDLAADCDPEAYQILNQILVEEGKQAISITPQPVKILLLTGFVPILQQLITPWLCLAGKTTLPDTSTQ